MFDPDKLDNEDYPHAWRGAVVCFTLGLAIMVLTDLFALLTICCTHCSNPEVRIRKKLQEKSEAVLRTPLERASKRAPT